MGIRGSRVLSALSAATLIAATLASAGPTAAAALITFDVLRGNTCVGGRPHDGTTPLTIKVFAPNGRLRDQQQALLYEGSYRACLEVTVRAGDRVRAVQGAVTRTVRMPDISLSVDRVTDVVRGRAPKDRPLVVTVTPCLVPDGESCSGYQQFPAHSNDEGRFRKDMTGLRDIIGGDQVAIMYLNSAGDRFWAMTYSPSFAVTGPGKASLSCAPGDRHVVKLRRESGSLKGTAVFADPDRCALSDAANTQRRFRRDGKAVNLVVDNILKADIATDARFRWPDMSIARDGNGAAGRCFPTARYRLEVFRPQGGALQRVGQASGTTQADGTLAAPAGPGFAVQVGDRLRLTCQTPRGDRAITPLTVAS